MFWELVCIQFDSSQGYLRVSGMSKYIKDVFMESMIQFIQVLWRSEKSVLQYSIDSFEIYPGQAKQCK